MWQLCARTGRATTCPQTMPNCETKLSPLYTSSGSSYGAVERQQSSILTSSKVGLVTTLWKTSLTPSRWRETRSTCRDQRPAMPGESLETGEEMGEPTKGGEWGRSTMTSRCHRCPPHRQWIPSRLERWMCGQQADVGSQQQQRESEPIAADLPVQEESQREEGAALHPE